MKDERWLEMMKLNHEHLSGEERFNCLFTHNILDMIPKEKRKEALKKMLPHLKRIQKLLED